MKHILTTAIIVPLLVGCWWQDDPTPEPQLSSNFNSEPETIQIARGIADEASGIAPCMYLKGSFWIHEDSNNPNQLVQVAEDGSLLQKIPMPFANYDWEDLGFGPGPIANKNYLYMADMGDNLFNRPSYTIYRFEEPTNGQLFGYDALQFTYSDGKNYDSEAIVIDPKTLHIYIFTKESSTSQIFKLAYPQKTDNMNIATKVGDVGMPFVTGGAISVSGHEVLLKSYALMAYWRLGAKETLEAALKRQVNKFQPFIIELQGEGVCFDARDASYVSISEINSGSTVLMNRYWRKP